MNAEKQTVSVHDGQCGLCAHFGEHHHDHEQELTQIRRMHEGPQDIVEECGHPSHAPLHLRVNITSGCDGFTPAA